MSWAASAWAKEVQTGAPATKAVLLCLADYTDADHTCFPGQETIARQTEQSVRSVRRHLVTLEERGILTRDARFDHKGNRTSDRYRLAVGSPEVAMLTDGQSDPRSTETEDAPTTGQIDPPPPDTGVRVTTSRTTSTEENPQASAAGAAAEDRTKGTRLPADWWPDTGLQDWYRAQPYANLLDPRMITDEFRGFWWAKTGANATKLDWGLTWQVWMSKEGRRAMAGNNGRAVDNRHTSAPDSPQRAALLSRWDRAAPPPVDAK